MTGISIAGDGVEWRVFQSRTQEGRPVIVRSRAGEATMREFANANFMARVRCVLASDQVNDGGMPASTTELDEFEDVLIDELERANAQTYELAVVTGDGNRDLYFTAVEGGELLAAIRAVPGERSFQLQLSKIDGPKDKLLGSLTAPAG
jgi:hypothetical protein